MRSDLLLLLLSSFLAGASVDSKPIDNPVDEGLNEINLGSNSDYKNSQEEITDEGDSLQPPASSPADDPTSSVKRSDPTGPAIEATGSQTTGKAENVDPGKNEANENSNIRPQGVAWFLSPFVQRVQFSPQAFFQDKLGQLRESLGNLGFGNREEDSKQLSGSGGLLNLVGLNDQSGFYTNRLDPVGFFGGNGWFANKGGIVGGPGALLSTGSVLTDYPTPYKK